QCQSQALAVRIGSAIRHPGREFATRGGPLVIDGAMHAFFAQLSAQSDTSLFAVLRPFHARSKWPYLGYQLGGNRTTDPARNLPTVKRYPEMGTTGTAAQARVVRSRVVRSRASIPV